MRLIGNRPFASPRQGFTLIETTVGLVIAILVIMMVILLYYTVTSTLKGQETRRRTRSAPVRALEQLARDLTRSLPADKTRNTTFELGSSDEEPNGVSLAFFTAVPDEAENDLRWLEIQRVQYSVVAEAAGRSWLQRESVPLTGPGKELPPTTNRLVNGVSRFQVELYQGGKWRSEWMADDARTTPVAARITLEVNSPGGRAFTASTDVFIPAGKEVPSTLERQGAPVPGGPVNPVQIPAG